MSTEIERKFLVAKDTWRDAADEGVPLAQGYLAGDSACSVRVRSSGEAAWLTIKGPVVGISRLEFEYPIPLDDAASILENLCAGRLLRKTRFRVRHAGHVWEVDEFHGSSAGLIVAEVELESEGETVEEPPWLGKEVSGDPRYMNAALALNPWKNWGHGEK